MRWWLRMDQVLFSMFIWKVSSLLDNIYLLHVLAGSSCHHRYWEQQTAGNPTRRGFTNSLPPIVQMTYLIAALLSQSPGSGILCIVFKQHSNSKQEVFVRAENNVTISRETTGWQWVWLGTRMIVGLAGAAIAKFKPSQTWSCGPAPEILVVQVLVDPSTLWRLTPGNKCSLIQWKPLQ